MTSTAPRDDARPGTDPRFPGWEAHLGAGGTSSERAARLQNLADRAQRAGAPSIRWWARGDTPDDAATARAAGFGPSRRLHRLGIDLGTDLGTDLGADLAPDLSDRPPITGRIRPFDAARDTADWLEVNNRAFHWHPDQRDWTTADLAAKVGEPWVRPDGLLVHVDDTETVDAFCFCRPHDEEDPPAAEIHLIAVHPDRHGTGLGPTMLTAGLRWMLDAGYRRAFLWVEADNEPALALYRRFGFTLDWSDAAYERRLSTP